MLRPSTAWPRQTSTGDSAGRAVDQFPGSAQSYITRHVVPVNSTAILCNNRSSSWSVLHLLRHCFAFLLFTRRFKYPSRPNMIRLPITQAHFTSRHCPSAAGCPVIATRLLTFEEPNEYNGGRATGDSQKVGPDARR